MSILSKLMFAILRPLWRMTRGMTLGAQAVVFNEAGDVLLVRHGYRPGWHFPGGGVEWNEALSEALARELYEETLVEVTKPPKLHGMFTNFEQFKGDHIAVFIVEHWQQSKMPTPNAEIKEIGFFPVNALPEGTTSAVPLRIAEIVDGQPTITSWT